MDPNTGLTLWESGAILLYLSEQYDTEKKLTYETLVEKNQLNQWLMFQISGQGPYYGQASWSVPCTDTWRLEARVSPGQERDEVARPTQSRPFSAQF